jgi:hypothetical protein
MWRKSSEPQQSKGAEHQRRHRYAVMTELPDLKDKLAT